MLRGLMFLAAGTEVRRFPDGIFSGYAIRSSGRSWCRRSTPGQSASWPSRSTALTLFFKFSRQGIALRAAADDQQAAMSMGIRISSTFGLSWALAASVAAAGGILLGNLTGVNFTLADLGLQVFPVVILGGLDSIVGAIVGGFLIGVLQNVASGYLDPCVGGGLKQRLSVLRPDRHPDGQAVRPVRARRHRAGVVMRYTRYAGLALLLVLFVALPLVASPYQMYVVDTLLVACIAALGLNLLTGFTGLISIGHGGFVGVGAFTSALLVSKLGVPLWLSVPTAGLLTALVGLVVGLPSLRIKGMYLAIATLAAQVIIEWVLSRPGIAGTGAIAAPRPAALQDDRAYYFVLLSLAVAAVVFAHNVLRTRIGRALIAVRDREIAASAIGVDVGRYKLLAFGLSSAYAGVAGALLGHLSRAVNYEQFQLDLSIQYLAMIVIGGLGSLTGSILGAVFITLMPILLRNLVSIFEGCFARQRRHHPVQYADVPVRTGDRCVHGVSAARPRAAVAPAEVFPMIPVSTPEPEVDRMVSRAVTAQRAFADWSEARVDALLRDIAQCIDDHARSLAIAAVAETGLGNVADKTEMHRLASQRVYASLVG